jgi:outer membrane protein OmpA-like peptidoglycan-associated protein
MLHRSVIETELSQNTRTALVHGNMEWATPTANGQIITLTGIATNSEARLQAASTVNAIEGVTEVNNQITIANVTNIPPQTTPAPVSSSSTSREKVDFSITAPNAATPSTTNHQQITVTEPVENREKTPTTTTTTEIATDNVKPTVDALDTSSTLVTPTDETSTTNDSSTTNAMVTVETTTKTETTKNAINTCQQQFNQQLRNEKIRFKTSSAILSANSDHLIIKLVKIAQSCPQFTIVIGGHTDSSGLDTMNQKLSEQRAQSVYNTLIKHGINGSTLSAIGYGESQPIAANNTPQGKAQNRRIEFKVQEN